MSTEPFDVTDLDQLSDVVVSVVIPLPDGRDARVKMRALPPSEIADIKRKIERPKPPVKDYKKIGSEAVPVYDYNDPAFEAASEEAEAELSRRVLVASLQMNITGNTVEEKCHTLRDKLGQAAYLLLINAVNRIGNPSKEDVERMMSSFRPARLAGTSDHDQAVTYPERVEKLTEERTHRNDGVPAGAKRKA